MSKPSDLVQGTLDPGTTEGAIMLFEGIHSPEAALIFRQGIQPILAGVALEVITSGALMRFLASTLFEVQPIDPTIFVMVPILLVAVA